MIKFGRFRWKSESSHCKDSPEHKLASGYVKNCCFLTKGAGEYQALFYFAGGVAGAGVGVGVGVGCGSLAS